MSKKEFPVSTDNREPYLTIDTHHNQWSRERYFKVTLHRWVRDGVHEGQRVAPYLSRQAVNSYGSTYSFADYRFAHNDPDPPTERFENYMDALIALTKYRQANGWSVVHQERFTL